MTLEQFNRAGRSAAIDALQPCADIRRWCEEIADGRPFSSIAALLDAARVAALPFRPEEIAVALTRHPRIGQRPAAAGTEGTEGTDGTDGTESTEAALSRAEQCGVDPADAANATALAAGNLAYEAKFGRVFLIRAAGRTGQEMLSALHERLHHTAAEEDRVTAEQLREIALVRLEGVVSA